MKDFIDNEAKRFLQVVGGQLDTDSRAFLGNGELAFEDAHFYVKKEITSMSGINDLVKPSDSEEVGIRSIDRARLPNLQNLILQKVIVRFATHATETDPAKLTFSSKMPSIAIGALINGEIEIAQDGKTILRLPARSFFNAADVDNVDNEGVELKNWRLIKAERPIEIKLHCANGETALVGSEKNHLEVVLVGTKTRKR
jgi:hypothetical protein